MIKHESGKYVLYSKDGKRKLGTFDTKEAAQERERQIVRLKHMTEGYSDEALEARVSRVRDAYYAQMGGWGVSPGEESPWIQEIRDASVIVAKSQDYFEVPYTLDADGAITFGEPTKVDLTYTPVTESQVPAANTGRVQFLEQRTGVDEQGVPLPAGSVWGVRVIAPGFSRNRSAALGLPRYYPAEILREAVPLFEGVRIFQHAAGPHVAAHERRGQDAVGWLTKPAFDAGIIAEFRCVEAPLRQKLVESFAQGKRDLLGFSINAEGREESGLAEGIRAAIVRQIGPRLHSVDIVTDPAAGGEFVTLVASIDRPQGGPASMTKEALLAKLKAARPDLVKDEPAGGWTLEGLEAKLEEALKPPPKVEPKVQPTALEEATRLTTDRLADLERKILMRERRALVDRTLDLAPIGKLAAHRTVVTKRMEHQLLEADAAKFEASLSEAIEDEGKVAAAYSDAGKVRRFGPATVTAEEQDKHQKAMDGMIAGADIDKVARFRSLHESYAVVANLRGADRINPQQMLREAIFYQPRTEYGLPNPLRESMAKLTESVISSTWGSMLGDSITRRMIQLYSVEDLQIWRKVVSNIEPIKDFRTMRRERFGGYGTIPAVGQGAPYQPLTSPTDQEATYAITKRGGTEDLTIETLANDDVGAVRDIPRRLGRAAGRTLKLFVFKTLIGDNPNVYDGTALAVAGHNNTTTSALSDATLKTAIQAMRDQAGFGDTAEILGGSNAPRWLLIPNELEDISYKLTRSDKNVGATNEAGTTPNLIQGRYGSLDYLVIDDWTDNNNWWLVADPAKQPTIEIGFWNGQEEPEMFVQDQPLLGSVFTADKVTYKLRHVYSGAILDHRMFYGGLV